MTITLRNFFDLDPDAVAQNADEISRRVLDDNGAIDLRHGVLRDILIHYYALLSTQRDAELNDYLSARSLNAVATNPTLATDEIVDDIASNFLTTRKDGGRASGDVTIIVSSNTTVTIAMGAEFSASGRIYRTTDVFTAKAEEGQINTASDRLLTRTADGNWAFRVTVEAEESGAAGFVAKDASVLPSSPPPNYVTSYAAADFSGGLDAETNEELVLRLRQGIAAKALSNRVNMSAMLREVEAFSRITSDSIIGYGDAEMLRDKHTIFPVAGGGRVDWYIRTTERCGRSTLTKTATFIGTNSEGFGIWQITIGRDDRPGFYEIASVRPTNVEAVGGFEVTEDIRGIDTTGVDFIPDFADGAAGIVESAYSRFQTAVIRFVDTEEDPVDRVVGDTADYDLDVVGLPLIAEIHDYVAGRSTRNFASDCVVKAPVPCFVSVGFTIRKRADQDDPDIEAIQDAVAAAINRTTFVGAIYASQVYDAVFPYLGVGQTVGRILLLGTIRYPDGTYTTITNDISLSAPNDPGSMVSRRTVQFYLDPSDISVSVEAGVPTDI